MPATPHLVLPAKPRPLLKHDKQACRAALEQALISAVPPSMRAMGRRLQCDVHYLYRRFPELCKAIAHRYLAFRHEEKVKRIERLRARIRQAVVELHRSGLFPSRNRVSGYLNLARFGSNRTIWEAWQAAVEELGLVVAGTATPKA